MIKYQFQKRSQPFLKIITRTCIALLFCNIAFAEAPKCQPPKELKSLLKTATNDFNNLKKIYTKEKSKCSNTPDFKPNNGTIPIIDYTPRFKLYHFLSPKGRIVDMQMNQFPANYKNTYKDYQEKLTKIDELYKSAMKLNTIIEPIFNSLN